LTVIHISFHTTFPPTIVMSALPFKVQQLKGSCGFGRALQLSDSPSPPMGERAGVRGNSACHSLRSQKLPSEPPRSPARPHYSKTEKPDTPSYSNKPIVGGPVPRFRHVARHQLHDYIFLYADEIHNKGTYRILPPEFPAAELSIAQMAPKQPFGVRHPLTQSPGELHSQLRHPSPRPSPLAGERGKS